MKDQSSFAPNERSHPEGIGLLGGTFDPVHFGHLRMAEEVLQTFPLSWVEFLPARTPPHKTDRPTTDISHRIAMLRLAITDNPSFVVSMAEAMRGGTSYLVDTLQEYRDQYSEDVSLFFIMGMDSFLEIHTWHRYPELFSLSHFVIVTRPGYEEPRLEEVVSKNVADAFVKIPLRSGCLEHESGHRIYFLETSLLDVSATRIRELIGSGKSVRYLVPHEVDRYIKKHNLYRKLEETP